MLPKKLPSQAVLKELFDYDNESGRLIRKYHPSKFQQHLVGKPAGSQKPNGRYQVVIDSEIYLHARLVYAYHFGDTEFEIDHRDGDCSNDCIWNLREANDNQQQHNKGVPCNNKSGTKGVCWVSARKRWRAFIYINGKCKWLGSFVNIKDAVVARKEAELKYHGEFARS